MKRDSLPVIFSILGLLLLVFILLPLLAALFTSNPGLVRDTLLDEEVRRSVVLTFGGSALAVFITTLGGIPLAYLLARRRFHLKRVVEAVVDLPVVIPHTAAGLALLLVFGSKGWLGESLSWLGIHFTDSLAGIVIAMAFVSLPYLVNMSRQGFESVDRELEQAARVDGASSWQSFMQIAIPGAWRGILGGMLMMWARGISEFGAVVILAYHPKILPVLLFERFQGFGLTVSQPLAVILIALVFVIFILLRAILLPERDE
jgi:molybdate/tungstate transport system permease protein